MDTRRTNITGFTVTVDVNGTTVIPVSSTDLSVTIDDLQVGTRYTAEVTASNCGGPSMASTTTIFCKSVCVCVGGL